MWIWMFCKLYASSHQYENLRICEIYASSHQYENWEFESIANSMHQVINTKIWEYCEFYAFSYQYEILSVTLRKQTLRKQRNRMLRNCENKFVMMCHLWKTKNKNMNIIIIITKISFEELNVKRRSLRTKIKKYLHRVKIVKNSKTLKLLRQTIVLLTIDSSSQTINNKDSKLYDILQKMQTIIEQL
jgi:hypothetical protein